LKYQLILDETSSKVCNLCHKHITEFYDFKQKVLDLRFGLREVKVEIEVENNCLVFTDENAIKKEPESDDETNDDYFLPFSFSDPPDIPDLLEETKVEPDKPEVQKLKTKTKKCPHCGKDVTKLKRHIQLVHKDLKYSCDDCDFKCSSNIQYLEHVIKLKISMLLELSLTFVINFRLQNIKEILKMKDLGVLKHIDHQNH
jgi:predicted RNA-binding Zn-ribbon protein involved in translation (DUF1610 family)